MMLKQTTTKVINQGNNTANKYWRYLAMLNIIGPNGNGTIIYNMQTFSKDNNGSQNNKVCSKDRWRGILFDN